MIRLATEIDAEKIVSIYNYYIQNSVITFEESPLTTDDMGSRIGNVTKSGLPWYVAEDEGKIVGYAYASEWNGRCAYRHSAEATVYLADGFRSRGWGTKLYEALFEELRRRSIHVVIGGITPPNPASVCRKVAGFHQLPPAKLME